MRLDDIYWVAWRELRHFSGQKARIIMMVVQPTIWLVLMGNMMSGLTSNPFASRMLGVGRYIDFMTPGIMAMTALFGGVYGGVSVIWDRRFGFLNKMLASPIARSAIPVGKMIATALQAMLQVMIIVVIAILLRVRFATGPLGVMLLVGMATLFGFAMSGISLALASVIKTHETLFAIVNFLTMPLIFTSNAMFPRAAMPSWLQTISRWNPVSYAVEPMRLLVTQGWVWGRIIPGIAFMVAFALLMVAIATWQFNKSIA